MTIPYAAAARMLHHLPVPPGTLRRSLQGRRGAAERWLDWAARQRAPGPLIWLHGASVGEALAADPILRRLRATNPQVQVVHTHTSPSVTDWPAGWFASRTDYVPEETPEALNRTIAALRPSLLLLARGDLWPGLLGAALARGVATAVVGADIHPASWRLRWPVRAALATKCSGLAYVGATSVGAARRWETLGVAPSAIQVTGDPRDDHVLERVTRIGSIRPLLRWADDHHVLVAGSAHRKDESVLLPALRQVRRTHPGTRLLLVPHRPHPLASRRIATAASRLGLPCQTWKCERSELETPVVVVERVGVLADLYAAGAIAYVGGGFRRGRVHSVAEPAAYGIPVIVGPCGEVSAEVGRFIEAGGAHALCNRAPTSHLAKLWRAWIVDPPSRHRAGLLARGELQSGAARKTVEGLRVLLGW